MIAIITSVIILLTPIQASAVTWGEIVTGLQASDTFKAGETKQRERVTANTSFPAAKSKISLK